MPSFLLWLLLGILFGAICLYFGTLALVVVLAFPLFVITAQAIRIGSVKVINLLRQIRWWHGAWISLFLSGLVFRIRETDEAVSTPLDFWALYRLGLVSLVGIVLLYRLVMRQPDWLPSMTRGSLGLLTGYAVLGICSTFWSVYPTWTLYKGIEYFIDIILIAAIVDLFKTTEDWKLLFDWTWVLLGALLLTTGVSILLWPSKAVTYGVGLLGIQIQGILPFVSSNGVGELGALLGIVALVRLLMDEKDKQFYLILFGFSVGMLILAQTRSALLGFLVALIVVLGIVKRMGFMVMLVSMIVVLLSFGAIGELVWNYILRGQNPELFASLSGRTEWWQLGWDLFTQRPLAGYGAYAGSRFAALTDAEAATTSSIHNTWLEALLGVGIFGFLLLLGAFLGVWIRLLKSQSRLLSQQQLSLLTIESIGIFTVLSIRSWFTSGLIWHPSLPFLLVLGFAEYIRRNRT